MAMQIGLSVAWKVSLCVVLMQCGVMRVGSTKAFWVGAVWLMFGLLSMSTCWKGMVTDVGWHQRLCQGGDVHFHICSICIA